MDQEQHTTTDNKVPNKNLEVLKAQFPQCFTKDGQFDLEKFKQELSANEVDFYKESYGLDWLGKSYARLLASDEATTLLREDEAHNQKPENKTSQNLLLKGDNLEVLKHLSNAYYEKVKMIYIDPPYNTGSDGFVYADDRKFTVQELRQLAGVDEEKAKRILEFTQSKSNSHSAWLTFMYPRLYIARQLMRQDGVIFISIDDNEVAQLKILMDEVFGEENFIASFLWEKRTNRENRKVVSTRHDYILSYARTVNEGHRPISQLPMSEKALSNYKNPDNDARGLWKSDPATAQAGHGTSGQFYELTAPNGTKHNLESGRCWLYTEEAMNSAIQDNRIWFGKNGNGVPRVKTYLESKDRGLTPETILFAEDVGTTESAKNQIKELFEGVSVFETPKSVSLIKRIMQMGVANDIILDFFAGSGSTGDAVMQLNAEDGGNRKYVLVQLPEVLDKKKDKTAYDFVKNELGVAEPTIFEITKERLIRAAKKVKQEVISSKVFDTGNEIKKLAQQLNLENKKEKLDALTSKMENLKNQDLGFRIFETMPIWEDYGLEADELDVQTQLFDESKLTEEDIKALLTTWKTHDTIPLTSDLAPTDLGGYTGHYGSNKLYLMDKGFGTDHLKALLERIDSDKEFNPTSVIAFGYHFESKALREVSENIKSYSNKKNIDIDFITRY